MEGFEEALRQHFKTTLGLPDWEKRVENYITGKRAETVFSNVGPLLDFDNKTVLDLGTGFGCLAGLMAEKVATYVGIEPSQRVKMAGKRFDSLPNIHFIQSVGEYLPFPDNSFDIVICHDVLEHVCDPQEVTSEIVRVLRDQGEAIVTAANYLGFYEPHYSVFYFPLCPKFLGRLYLRLRGRDPSFLDTVNYTTRGKCAKYLKKAASGATHLEYYEFELENLRYRLKNPDTISNARNARIATLVRKARLSTILLHLLKTFKLGPKFKIKVTKK